MNKQHNYMTFYRDGREFQVVRLVHLTPISASRKARDGKVWKTVATVKDMYNGVEATGIAWCGRKDNPSRKTGRNIAIGRAVAKLSPLRGVLKNTGKE